MTSYFDSYKGADRFAEWIKTLDVIDNISQSLEEDIAILKNLKEWYKHHPRDRRLTSDMCGWISKLSARSIAIAIRSLTDPSKDTYSIRGLLLDIRANIDIVDIKYWPPADISERDDEIQKNYEIRQREEFFKKIWGADSTAKCKSIQKLLDDIPAIDDIVRKYATQEIAHALRETEELDLNFETLISVGDGVLAVIRDLNMKLKWSQRIPMDIRLLRLFPEDE